MRIRIASRSGEFLGAGRRWIAPNSARQRFQYYTLRLANHEAGRRIPEQKAMRKVVLQYEVNRSCTIRVSRTDQVQRNLMPGSSRDQRVGFGATCGRRFQEDQSRLGLGMLGLEGARISQDYRTDVLGQSYGTDVPRSQVQDSHALWVERQAQDSRIG